MNIAEMVPETPAFVIDRQKAQANVTAAIEATHALGVKWRPHVKTHKLVEFARMQIDGGADGISCAKVSEAEVMAAGGIDDIFIAYPLVGEFRLARAAALARKIRLILTIDSAEGARALSEFAVREGVRFEVRMEVDTDFGRTGVKRPAAVDLARLIASMPNLDLTGIATFRSMTYDGKPTRDARLAGTQEAEQLLAVAATIREAGIPIQDVSGGSTPTGIHVAAVPGITEIRQGTNIFHDYTTYNNGCCAFDDIAAAIVYTVVSTPDPSYAIVDGGSKALASDFPVRDAAGQPQFAFGLDDPQLILTRMYEEHGAVVRPGGVTGLRVGQRLAMVPAHVCSTLNLFNDVYVLDNGSLRKVPVDARGMVV